MIISKCYFVKITFLSNISILREHVQTSGKLMLFSFHINNSIVDDNNFKSYWRLEKEKKITQAAIEVDFPTLSGHMKLKETILFTPYI